MRSSPSRRKGTRDESSEHYLKKGILKRENLLRLHQPKSVAILSSLTDCLEKNGVEAVNLEVDNNEVLRAALHALADYGKLTRLMVFSWNPNGDDSLRNALQRCCEQNLELLHVTFKCPTNPDMVQTLLKSLPKKVKTLDLSDNLIKDCGPEFVKNMERVFCNNPLEELCLRNCGVTKETTRSLFRLLDNLGHRISLKRLIGLDFSTLSDLLPDPVRAAILSTHKSSSENFPVLEYFKNKAFARLLPGTHVRVWWPPTLDPQRKDFAGRYWPARVLQVDPMILSFLVEYDNRERDQVSYTQIQPLNPFQYGGGARVGRDLIGPVSTATATTETKDKTTADWGREIVKASTVDNSVVGRGGTDTFRTTDSNRKRGRKQIPISNAASSTQSLLMATERVGVKGVKRRLEGNGTMEDEVLESAADREALRKKSRGGGGGESSTVYTLSPAGRMSSGDHGKKHGMDVSKKRRTSDQIERPPEQENLQHGVARGVKRIKREKEIDEDRGETIPSEAGSLVSLPVASSVRAEIHQLMTRVKNSQDVYAFEELVLNLPPDQIGDVLWPGEICEMREPQVLDLPAADPSDFLMRVEQLHPVEPVYGCKFIFHDDQHSVDVWSKDVRRTVYVSWPTWRDDVLKRRRYVEDEDLANRKSTPLGHPVLSSSSFSRAHRSTTQSSIAPASKQRGSLKKKPTPSTTLPTAPERILLDQDLQNEAMMSVSSVTYFKPEQLPLVHKYRSHPALARYPNEMPMCSLEYFAVWTYMKAMSHKGSHPTLMSAATVGVNVPVTMESLRKEVEELKQKISLLTPYYKEALEVREHFDRFRCKVEEIKKFMTCCICLETPLSVLTLPCRHLATCAACCEKIGFCPWCRTKISRQIGVVNFSSDLTVNLCELML